MGRSVSMMDMGSWARTTQQQQQQQLLHQMQPQGQLGHMDSSGQHRSVSGGTAPYSAGPTTSSYAQGSDGGDLSSSPT